mmetsp:Transcript_11613/g.15049  ORF Transcript_11613/g.15049 Transcript_11613/m.15049 type:complete len:668 (+) Transcript_11613:181-2184(+)
MAATRFLVSTMILLGSLNVALAEPVETNAEEALFKFRLRQQKYLSEAIKSNQHVANTWLKQKYSMDYDTEIVERAIDRLIYEEDPNTASANPDFIFVPLIRLMQYTKDFDRQILEKLQQLHFWYGKGEDYRVYWSENHMIMWTGSAFLLQEKYGEDIIKVDSEVRNRLLWFLQSKQKTGYFEWMSTIYSGLTFRALMNVYDYAVDGEIKEEARKAVLAQIKQSLLHTDSLGCVNSVSGRSSATAYFDRKQCSEFSAALANLVLGIGTFTVDDTVAFLADSDIDVTELILEFSTVVDGTFRLGVDYEEGMSVMKSLTRRDRITAQMSLGGYAAPEYFEDTFSNVAHYGLWNNTYFKSHNFIRRLPEYTYNFASWLVSSRGASSVLFSDNEKLYKHKSTMLNSLENYYPGYGGAQQMVYVASTGGVAAFTASGSPIKRTQVLNTHLPYIKQEQNVALIVYYPNWDLSFLGLSEEYTYLYFEEDEYDETFERGKWIFGRVNDSYVAFNRHCVSEFVVSGMSFCEDTKQSWISMVGHEETHGSFSNFVSIAEQAKISTEMKGQCIESFVAVDGKRIQIEFCRNMGSIFVVMMGIILIGFFAMLLLAFCCRRKRAVWKSTYLRARQFLVDSKLLEDPNSPAAGKIQEGQGSPTNLSKIEREKETDVKFLAVV